MKVIIQDGRIVNFVDDNHLTGNKDIDNGVDERVSIKEVKGFSKDINQDALKFDNAMREGIFPYYLDNKGKLQILVIKDQPEYIINKQNQRISQYRERTDNNVLKAVRELLNHPNIKKLLSVETQDLLGEVEKEVTKIKTEITY